MVIPIVVACLHPPRRVCMGYKAGAAPNTPFLLRYTLFSLRSEVVVVQDACIAFFSHIIIVTVVSSNHMPLNTVIYICTVSSCMFFL